MPSSSEEIARMAHADIKNITGDDQATLTVHHNYANIMQSFEIYVYEIGTDALRLNAVFWRLLKRHVADVKSFAGNDQVTLS